MSKAALLLALILLAGCAAPNQQGPEKEDPSPPGGIPPGGRVELPVPEEVDGSPSRRVPPPVWLIADGEVIQASYGEYCAADICMGEEPRASDLATAEVPAGEKVLVVVGSQRTIEFAAGVVGWEDASDVPTRPGAFTKSGVPYFMRALDSRLMPEGEGPTAELTSGGEERIDGLTMFEVASTGNPGDRQLSVFMNIGEPYHIGRDQAAYHWRLNPGQEGDNPPPEQKEFSGEVVEVTSGPETAEYSPEEASAVQDVEKTPFGEDPHGIEAGEGYLWVLDRGQSQADGLDKGKAASKAGPQEEKVLLKVDPDTREVRSTIDELDFRTILEVGAGAVWLAGSEEGSVTRVDPETEVTRTVDIGGSPTGIVATEDGVWVSVYDDTQSGRVVRIDPATNAIVAEIETPGIAESPVVDEESGDIWVVTLDQTQGRIDYENNQLVRINSATNDVSERFKVEGGVTSIAAAGSGTVWVNTGTGSRQAIAKVNPQSREIEGLTTRDLGSARRDSPEIEAGSLWTATRGVVSHLNLESGRITSPYVELGEYEAEDLAVGEGAVWVIGAGASFESGTLTRITP